MEKFIPKSRKGPEAIIQEKIVKKLTLLGWYVKETHGNVFQYGFPDIFATHSIYKQRWIEVKNPDGWQFTAAQHETFPKFIANGAPIWVLMGDSDFEINKLFAPSNMWYYLSGGK